MAQAAQQGEGGQDRMRPHAAQVIDTAAWAEQQRQPRHHAERGPAVEEAVEQQGAQCRHASASASEVKAAMSGSMGPRSRAPRYLVYSVIRDRKSTRLNSS